VCVIKVKVTTTIRRITKDSTEQELVCTRYLTFISQHPDQRPDGKASAGDQQDDQPPTQGGFLFDDDDEVRNQAVAPQAEPSRKTWSA
jgi:hypothetical protein